MMLKLNHLGKKDDSSFFLLEMEIKNIKNVL